MRDKSDLMRFLRKAKQGAASNRFLDQDPWKRVKRSIDAALDMHVALADEQQSAAMKEAMDVADKIATLDLIKVGRSRT